MPKQAAAWITIFTFPMPALTALPVPNGKFSSMMDMVVPNNVHRIKQAVRLGGRHNMPPPRDLDF